MFELLNKESWELNTEQLINKKKQIRIFMWFYALIFFIFFISGSILWILTDWFKTPLLFLMMSIILFNGAAMIKIWEFLISLLISIRKGDKELCG